MALLGNYTVLNKSPLRKFSGTSQSSDRSNFSTSGALRCALFVDRTVAANSLYALPEGSYTGLSWLLPQKVGRMASRDAQLTVSGVSTGAGGITTTGTATLSVTTNTPSAQLIAFGTGLANFLISTNSATLTAPANAIGSASLTLSTNNPLLGAIASVLGSADFTVNGAADRLPLDDTSPSRSATGGMTISAALTPYAKGYMQGSTVDSTTLTADIISKAVWNALLAQFPDAGTAGNALALASSGGVDYSALATAVWQHATRALTESGAALTVGQAEQLAELHKLHGLAIGTDLIVSDTSRVAGSITQTISSSGSTTTVARV